MMNEYSRHCQVVRGDGPFSQGGGREANTREQQIRVDEDDLVCWCWDGGSGQTWRAPLTGLAGRGRKKHGRRAGGRRGSQTIVADSLADHWQTRWQTGFVWQTFARALRSVAHRRRTDAGRTPRHRAAPRAGPSSSRGACARAEVQPPCTSEFVCWCVRCCCCCCCCPRRCPGRGCACLRCWAAGACCVVGFGALFFFFELGGHGARRALKGSAWARAVFARVWGRERTQDPRQWIAREGRQSPNER